MPAPLPSSNHPGSAVRRNPYDGSRLSFFALIAAFALVSAFVSAQIPTGTPPYSTIGAGTADSINLANLNVHFTFPVLHKAGRGLPVSMDLTYDNTIWFPASNGVNLVWEPVLTGGWSDSMSNLGGAYFSAVVSGSTILYCDFVYYDGQGTGHFFPGPNPNICPATSTSTFPVVVAATDGSGYQLTITACSGSACAGFINARDGSFISPPVNTANGVGSVTDRNGNTISEDASGNFTDTLGLIALKVAGTVTPTTPNPITYTYTAPSGAAVAVTQSYKSFTVKTNFGCGIVEYGPLTASLVDRVTLPDGTFYQFTYEATPGGPVGDVTGRLASIKLPTGGTITYTYTGVNCNDGTTWGMIRNTPDGQWTYQRSTTGGTAFTTTVTDPQGNQTVIQFQGFLETQRQSYQGSSASGTLLQTTFTCYNGSVSPCNGTAITPPITQKSVITQLGTVQSKKVYTFPSNGSGVLLEEDDFDYGSGTPGPLLKKTIYTYAALGAIKSSPATITVMNGSGQVLSQTTNRYDETGLTATTGTPQHTGVGTNPRGNLTTTQLLTQGASTISQHFTYYDTGTLQTATDYNGAQTTYLFGSGSCGNSFPTTVNEAATLSRSMTWNCVGGVQTSTTDENGQITSISYTDPFFWRIGSTTDPAGGATTYTYQGATGTEAVLTINAGQSTADILETVDGLGRKQLHQTRQAPGSTTFDIVETDYDGLGRQRRQTLPYTGTAGQTSATAPATITTYDNLGRVLTLTDAGGGTSTYTYSLNDQLLVAGPAPAGENAKQRQFEYDGLGRLISVCEITSATGSGACGQRVARTGYLTKYSYDALGNLTGVTQNAQAAAAAQQTRTYSYDGLGRVTAETNPESGTTTYTYDTDATCGTSLSDLVRLVDAVGNTACYAYDSQHRQTSTTYSGPYAANTPNKYFVYDAATIATTPTATAMVNTKGLLAEAYTATCPTCAKITDQGFSYSARKGEVSDIYQATSHSGGYSHLHEAYWPNGQASQLSGNLGVPTLNFTLDGEGRAASAAIAAGQTLASSVSYNPASQPIQINLGTGDSDVFGYDSNTIRMTQYKFNVNSQAVIGSLTWNANSTLRQLATTNPYNAADNQTCAYGYDDLRRVASVNCAPPGSATASTWQQTFTYDAFGNISKSGSISFLPTYIDAAGHTSNRVVAVSGCTVSYDANGNALNDCSHTYTWNSEGRPVSVDTTGLTYDAFSRMVEQNRSGAFTQIVYAPTGEKFALMSGQTLQKAFVPLPASVTAVFTTAGVNYYRHKDWLGSSRFASTSALAATPGRGNGTISGSEQSVGSGTNATGTVTIAGFEQSKFVCDPTSPGCSGCRLRSCGVTVFDSGTVRIIVNGHTNLASYSSGSNSSTIATALTNAINADSAAFVTATVSTNVITLTSKTVGAASDYTLTTSVSFNSSNFTSASFTATPSGATLTGGTSGTPIFDTGSVWITVNGVQVTTSYGQTSTPLTLASALAGAINASTTIPVSASASGALILLTAKTQGTATNYTLSSGSSTSQPAGFSTPSFAVAVSGAALTGGSAGATTMFASTAYAPFGEAYSQAGATDVSFAGSNSDTASGLYDAEARELNIQGRWISPDPSGLASVHFTDPQTLNRYAYSRNNPIGLSDPSGLDFCDFDLFCDGGGFGGGIGGFPDIWSEQWPIYTGPPLDPSLIIFNATDCHVNGPDAPTPVTCDTGDSVEVVATPLPMPDTGDHWWRDFFSDLFSLDSFGQAQQDAWDKGYYSCIGNKMIPFKGLLAAAGFKAGEEAITHGLEHGGGSKLAGAYYHFTDGRFTAWGKYSKVLVPEAAEKIAKVAKVGNVLGWALTDVELAEAIHACSKRLTGGSE